MRSRNPSAQPGEPPAKDGRPTRTATAKQRATAAAAKEAGAKSQTSKPKTRATPAAIKPKDSKAAETKTAATKPARSRATRLNAPPVCQPPENDSEGEETESVAAPRPVPSYHPEIVVKGNNILLSGPWTVRKYSNDFENDEERLELERLKDALAKRAAASMPDRGGRRSQTSGINEDDFEQPGREGDLAHDEDSDNDDRRQFRPDSNKGKRPVSQIDHTERFVVKHQSHGGGIFDPRFEVPPPMTVDRRYQYGQYHRGFTQAQGSMTEGWLGPKPGIHGAWHFKCFGAGDSDNMCASKLMGGKGFFHPDTQWPNASDIQAYRDYLRTYQHGYPRIGDATKSINIVWLPYDTDRDPHGLKDRPDDQQDPPDGSEHDADAEIDRDPGRGAGKQGTSRGDSGTAGGRHSQQTGNSRKDSGSVSPLSMPQDDQGGDVFSPGVNTNPSDTIRSRGAIKSDHQQSKKRKNQAAPPQQSNEALSDGSEDGSSLKRTRRSYQGASGPNSEGDDSNERS